jgi:hypothetical protein
MLILLFLFLTTERCRLLSASQIREENMMKVEDALSKKLNTLILGGAESTCSRAKEARKTDACREERICVE